ncbi:MAG: sodium transporter, partial [Fidelibacterota bacterium]
LKFPSLWHYLQNVLAYAAPPVVALYLVGLFYKRANRQGAWAGIIFGFIFGIGQLILRFTVPDLSWLPDIHFLYMAGILLVTTTIVIVVVSLITPPPDPDQVDAYIWKSEDFKKETIELKSRPWYQNYRILSVLLLIMTAVVVGMFA